MALSRPPSGTPRTVYESRARRLRRRRRAVAVAVGLLAAAAAVAVGVSLAAGRGAGDRGERPGDSQAAARRESASPGPSSRPSASASPAAAAVRTAVLGAAEVHRGQALRLRYRIDDPAGRTWAATLVVLAADGTRARAQGLGDAVASGVTHSASFRVALPPGRYTDVVHVRDEAGEGEDAARPAGLTVLPPLPPVFPGAGAVAAALSWVSARPGTVATAVVDSHGRLSGLHEHETFQGASLVKAMLLAAYLRSHPQPDASLDQVATKMIEESDNASAYVIQGVVGTAALARVAALAGMRDFVPGSGWVDARVSAADQARFFYDYLRYVPPSRRAFARRLLSGITYMQRWGIPAAAGPDGWRVFFKGGWLGMDNRLMVQVGWLEKGREKWALAVMTDENPSRSSGWDTEKGFTGLLLGRQPTAAYLALVLE